jgi:hypothetical protein
VPRSRPTAGHLLRWFTLGSGPLKRTSDRLQVLARVLLVVSLVTAIPISLAVATAAYTQARTQALTQAADRHRVTARLLDAVPAPAGEAQSSITPDRERATAVWTDPAGIEHRASVSVPVSAKAKAGVTVSVWVDRDGNRTTRPLSEGDVTGQAVGRGLVTFGGLAVIEFAAYRSARRLLDRHRSRRWAADWAVVEPVWTRRVP